jgi:hypothetical protein
MRQPEKERPLHRELRWNGLSVVSPFDGTNRIRFKGSRVIATLSLDPRCAKLPPKLIKFSKAYHSAANEAHRPRGLCELWVVDVVAGLLFHHDRLDVFDNFGARRVASQDIAQGVFDG